ncbi:MAG: hypothetical protein RIR62_876 [Pseudomonadota bacterium]|jgi:FMN-dependent NADH-azoreductase
MTRILRIETATAGRTPPARALANRLLSDLTAAHPAATVRLRDLTGGLPPVTAPWRDAAALPEEARDDDQCSLMAPTQRLRAEVAAADLVLIGVELQTGGLPAPLKAWIDHLCGAGQGLAARGRAGVLTGKRVILAVADEGAAMPDADFATPYLLHILSRMGAARVDVVTPDGLTSADLAA